MSAQWRRFTRGRVVGSVFSLSMISPSARIYLLHMRGAGRDCLRVCSLGMVMESIFFAGFVGGAFASVRGVVLFFLPWCVE